MYFRREKKREKSAGSARIISKRKRKEKKKRNLFYSTMHRLITDLISIEKTIKQQIKVRSILND
jgi:hypothetical protein